MEGRIRNFLLKPIIGSIVSSAVILVLLTPVIAIGAEPEDDQKLKYQEDKTLELESQELKSVMQPEIVRSKFDESNIETADFEIITNAGIISIEDFGSNPVLGLKLNYHVSDDFFIGAEIALAEGQETSFELLSGGAPLLSGDERKMNTYLLTLGYNVLPGEAFLTDNITYNTAFYLIGGLGNTEFGGENHFTVSIGAGHRIILGNFFSIYTDFRDNIFSIDLFGKEKTTHNLQFTVGAGFYF